MRLLLSKTFRVRGDFPSALGGLLRWPARIFQHGDLSSLVGLRKYDFSAMRGHSRTLPAIVFRFPAARDKFSREGHAGPTELLCSGDDDDTKFGPGWTDSRMARSQTDRGLTANGHPSGREV